jgi:hypothetical protein
MFVIGTAISFSAATADSLNVRLVGTYTAPEGPVDVAVADSLALVADFGRGLRIVSIADPTNPTELGVFTGPNTTMGVAVRDTLAYVAGHRDGLYIVNIADPANPVQVGRRGTSAVTAKVAIQDTLAFIADRSAGLSIISVADPSHPYLVGSFYDSLASVTNDVAVAGDYAYATTALRSRLQVINVADPANPTLAGQCSLPGPGDPNGLVVSGGRAYVGTGDVVILDVANPLNPHELGCYVSPSYAYDLTVRGDTAFVPDGYSGLRVVDVSDPLQPRELGYNDTPGNNNGIALAGEYICVTENPIGMRIFQYYGAGIEEERPTPDASRLTPCATVVRGVLFLPKSTSSSPGCLLDAAGRRVQDLHPGANDIRRFAPGVYFVRPALAQAQARAVHKVVIQR